MIGAEIVPGVTQYDVGAAGRPISEVEIKLRDRLDNLRLRMLEAWSYEDNYIDPLEAYKDEEGGEDWLPIGVSGERGKSLAIQDEATLQAVRTQMRQLSQTNEFAINGHENRISYIVGSGHKYSPSAKEDGEVSPERLAEVQAVIDDFIEENQWHKRQQEIVRRKDRDGECFLRFFPDGDGMIRVRFVEPYQVRTPSHRTTAANESWGIVTAKEDVEDVTGYWIDDTLVDASEIQHRKANVDFNVKRGLPLFYPVRLNLKRAENLLYCMAEVAKVQAAIAMIRKHSGITGAGIEAALAADSDVDVKSKTTGKTTHFRHYPPGSILDVPKAVDYEFPAGGIDASKFVAILQAELRAVASRLCMPEFMLTSDASNANYSSTMVAEGPAVKIFQRLQYDLIVEDLEVMKRVLDAAVEAGKLDPGVRKQVTIEAEPPRVETRNEKDWAATSSILIEKEVMSRWTARLRHQLDPDFEEDKIKEERNSADPFGGMANFLPQPRQALPAGDGEGEEPEA